MNDGGRSSGSAQPCSRLSSECPASGSFYGYAPNLGANAFFLAMFVVLCSLNILLGILHKTWTYMVAMALACAGASIGYAGRVIMHYNPYNNNGFMIQITCLIISPAFNSAAIYLTLKHITLQFGPQFSRIRPAAYTYIFIAGDLISIIVQGVGGALASSVHDTNQLKLGNTLMNVGVSWQVACLVFFACTAFDYMLRRWQARISSPLDPISRATLHDARFCLFVGGVLVAMILILARCIYRIVEMAGGFGNKIMKEEVPFIVLEGG